MDMLVSGESSPAEVSDKIKEILYTKASEKVDTVKTQVGSSLFGDEQPDEVVDELEVESEEDEEEETQTGDEDVN